MMMKAQFLLLCIAIIPFIYACPELSTDLQIELSYRQIEGSWKLAASKPALNDKCLNITIHDYTLTKEYYSKILYLWTKKSSSEYTIINEVKPVALNLKPTAWYSALFGQEKLTLVGVNYDSFALFYSCTKTLFHSTENYYLWTRGEVDSQNLPTGVTERLALFNLKPTDLTFRTAKDCNY